ncbi:hypothetical protein VTL71DRAFT_14650 [Oculimacula yallundae]|uniref:Uncharacterized protein n=1 Tax=Oculimacula yallundae TaxID=86028 RepID=A0ABR4CJP0_9HELO
MASLDTHPDPNAPTTAEAVPAPGQGPARSSPAIASEIHIPTTITLRTPSTHRKDTPTNGEAGQTSTNTWQSPPLNWLARTWTVTHSTLPMWRKAKNVRITYKLLAPSSPNAAEQDTLLDDEVSSEPTSKTFLPQPKSIRGVDTPDHSVSGGGAWNWRGRGWLRIASSHWEILGWGEWEGSDGQRECWVLTWFEKSLFTPMGVDLYSDRKGGGSMGLVEEVRRVLESGEAGEGVRKLCVEGEGLFKVVVDDA